MTYITGDIHCPYGVSKLNVKHFPQQKQLTKEDYLIICGDMGIVWDGGKTDKYWQKWFNERNYTTLFVDGNHENHPMLNSYPIVEFCGGRAHQIANSVYHLMRGEIYTINDKTFYCFGGAESHDKWMRVEGKDWWPEEVATIEEMDYGSQKLRSFNDKIDYVITHDCPFSVKQQIIKYQIEKDAMTSYFQYLSEFLQFKHWYFGHYHIDKEIGDKYTCLYQEIKEIK